MDKSQDEFRTTAIPNIMSQTIIHGKGFWNIEKVARDVDHFCPFWTEFITTCMGENSPQHVQN